MTREQFAAAVKRMTEIEGAVVRAEDWSADPNSSLRKPYRMANASVVVPATDTPVRIIPIAQVAADICGYLTVSFFEDRATISLSVSRELDSIETAMLVGQSIEVSIGEAMRP